MMLRAVLAAVLAVTTTFGVILPTAATAGPIEERQAIMKANGRDTKMGGDMLKGATPFDAATANKILANYAAAAKAFPAHFPAGSNTGETEAAPAIWSKPADWKAATAKFQADTAAAAALKPTDAATFGKAFGMVTANCKSCHEGFRIKKG
ncbi:MAG: cytochrome c [Sandarakinorhabdus sp.]|nr:cytochrome c [Sandarakinorhabdus sp.]